MLAVLQKPLKPHLLRRESFEAGPVSAAIQSAMVRDTGADFWCLSSAVIRTNSDSCDIFHELTL